MFTAQKTLYNNKGFTLLELLMTVAILGIFISTVYGFTNYNLRFLNESNNEQEANHQARLVMLKITNELSKYKELEYKKDGKSLQIVSKDEYISIEGLTQNMDTDQLKDIKFAEGTNINTIQILIETNSEVSFYTEVRIKR